jgi:integrase
VDDVKTEYSRDFVPLAPELAAELLKHREQSYPTEDGWLFANPRTGKPYHQEEIQKKHIQPAAMAAEIKTAVGWKTFRHSYRSWLDETEAPIGVQRELMRHASIQTTMNVYGRAMTDSKRQAHGNVVQMVLKSAAAGPTPAAEDREPVAIVV